jgi:hypothetical protein
MESRPSQQAQGTGPQSQEPVNFPLRPGEQVVFVTRWDGGWANSIATFAILGIACLAGLIIGDFWAFVGLVFGFATIAKLILEVLSRVNGRAVLTNHRIVVKGLPSPFISKEIELTDVQGLNAGADLVRAGGGMSSMTVTSRSGSKKGIVIPNASKFVEAYNARFRG